MGSPILCVGVAGALLVAIGCTSDELVVVRSPAADTHEFRQEVRINASVETVWRAITEPRIVSPYYLCPLTTMELGVGGKVIYGLPEEPFVSGMTCLPVGGFARLLCQQ